ncbi:MAG: hypothetical protein MJE77_34915 [Proteobacteria bacterium]|nr:hypothetical protein [Pseudomonadota bacterium]
MNRTGLVVANLDCEQEYARDPHRRRPPDRLPAPVRRMISSAGALMVVFARDGDVLWTPEPIDRERVALARGRDIGFVSGQLDRQVDRRGRHYSKILSWAETETIAALRPEPGESRRSDAVSSWPQLVWRVWPDPALARRGNDRRHGFAIARELGSILPGSAILSSPEMLVRHLARRGHEYGHQGAWVLKAPFSAAGRQRVRRRGRRLDDRIRKRVVRLFHRCGELVFEPWVDRLVDFGCVGMVLGPDQSILLPPHRLYCDAAGVFRGVGVGKPDHWPEQVIDAARAIGECAGRVARYLGRDGYRGPFGIDGFAYRDAHGKRRVHALCEINARLSFGHIAHALAAHYPERPVTLRLGSGPVPRCEGAEETIVPLLLPGQSDDTSAWLEVASRHPFER